MASPIAFYLLAACVLLAAAGVVSNRNILHAGLSLIICFWCVAGVYLLLDAPFLAVIQVLIYVGAISVLLLFAIMLTHRISTREGPAPVGRLIWGSVLGAGFLFLACGAFYKTGGFAVAYPKDNAPTIVQMAENFMDVNRSLVPFEIVGVLLLVALIGAVIVARKDEPVETGGAA